MGDWRVGSVLFEGDTLPNQKGVFPVRVLCLVGRLNDGLQVHVRCHQRVAYSTLSRNGGGKGDLDPWLMECRTAATWGSQGSVEDPANASAARPAPSKIAPQSGQSLSHVPPPHLDPG